MSSASTLLHSHTQQFNLPLQSLAALFRTAKFQQILHTLPTNTHSNDFIHTANIYSSDPCYSIYELTYPSINLIERYQITIRNNPENMHFNPAQPTTITYQLVPSDTNTNTNPSADILTPSGFSNTSCRLRSQLKYEVGLRALPTSYATNGSEPSDENQELLKQVCSGFTQLTVQNFNTSSANDDLSSLNLSTYFSQFISHLSQSLSHFPVRSVPVFSKPLLHAQHWSQLLLHDTDIVIATHAKTGTTWTQQIVWQLLNNGNENSVNVHQWSPWVEHNSALSVEHRVNMLNNMQKPRVLKTHLPLSSIIYSPSVKYIYIVRAGLDQCISMFNHHCSFTEQNRAKFNHGAVMDFNTYFEKWLYGEDSFWNMFDSVNSWWNYRYLPNVLFLHFGELKVDLAREIKKIAQFLNIPSENSFSEKVWNSIAEHCAFDWMKNHEQWFSPPEQVMAKGKFLLAGSEKRWQGVMSEEQIQLYEKVKKEKWSEECAAYIDRSEAQIREARKNQTVIAGENEQKVTE